MLFALGLMLAAADTVRVTMLPAGTAVGQLADSTHWGPAAARWPGGARLWVLRDSANISLVAWLPDSTTAAGDRITIALDTQGDRAPNPQHDDFAWEFHRVLDSSVIFRGRDGRWQPPRDDPDWRLGSDREGGGWRVQAREEAGGWLLLLRLDPEYFTPGANALPGLAVASYDESSRRWLTWPAVPPGAQPAGITDRPKLWGSVQP